MTRVTILSATIAILLCMWVDNEPAQPTWLESLVPKVSQVDWCVIDELAAGQDHAGRLAQVLVAGLRTSLFTR